METALELIGDYSRRGLFDKTFVEGEVVEEIGLDGRLEYQRVNPGPLISHRDMVFATRKLFLEDNRIMWVASSVEDDLKPPVKKVVRGHMFIGGWLLEPHEEDPDKCFAYFLAKGDAKGAIPKFAVNFVAKEQGFVPMKLNKCLHEIHDE
uniref:START domain-containing protein n=1 Tax=Euplotes crassus TaxID=5936 RepID=A0A7S3NRT3_EUPCR|mmetsp:Transcript_25196/g.24960  ORF Transcript_25196/g.24960 Transcript_25196/m.24960 type:complete len:150 (+) Transcript_25196:231-680(+)